MKIEVGPRYPGWISGDAPRLDFSNIVHTFHDRAARTEDTIAVALGRAQRDSGIGVIVLSTGLASHLGWNDFVEVGAITRWPVDCNHLEMVKGKHAEELAAFIEERINGSPGPT